MEACHRPQDAFLGHPNDYYSRDTRSAHGTYGCPFPNKQYQDFLYSPITSIPSPEEARFSDPQTPPQLSPNNLRYPDRHGTPDGEISFRRKNVRYTEPTPPGTEESSSVEEDDEDDQMDDTVSIHSMTTWPDREPSKGSESSELKQVVRFDYDWADANADEPPVPWEEVPSYIDFHANRVAHDYWKWDPDVQKWKHIDEKTGETIYCPAELD